MARRSGPFLALLAPLVTLTWLGGIVAGASTSPPPPARATTGAPPTSATTTTGLVALEPMPTATTRPTTSSTRTTTPRSPATTATTTPTPDPSSPSSSAGESSSSSTPDAAATTGPGHDAGFPADLAAIAATVPRSPPSNTTTLVSALGQLQRFGLNPTQAAIIGMGAFPVAGVGYYADDWLEPRLHPTPHLHQGNDVFAAMGTPLRAPADGVLSYGDDPGGYGLTAVVTMADGTYFLMAHLSATVLGRFSGDHVTQGQVVGFVGASGNANGVDPHCHFELHPRGGLAVDPKGFLDWAQADALARLPGLVRLYEGATARPAPTTALPSTTLLDPASAPIRGRDAAALGGRPPPPSPSGGSERPVASAVAGLALLGSSGGLARVRRVSRRAAPPA